LEITRRQGGDPPRGLVVGGARRRRGRAPERLGGKVLRVVAAQLLGEVGAKGGVEGGGRHSGDLRQHGPAAFPLSIGDQRAPQRREAKPPLEKIDRQRRLSVG